MNLLQFLSGAGRVNAAVTALAPLAVALIDTAAAAMPNAAGSAKMEAVKTAVSGVAAIEGLVEQELAAFLPKIQAIIQAFHDAKKAAAPPVPPAA